MSWFSVSDVKSQPDEEAGSKALDSKHNVIDIFKSALKAAASQTEEVNESQKCNVRV